LLIIYKSLTKMKLVKYGEERLQKNTYNNIDFSKYIRDNKKYEIFIKTDNDSVVSSQLHDTYFEITTDNKVVILKWVILEMDHDATDMAYYFKNYPIF